MPTRRTFLSVFTLLGTTGLTASRAVAATRRHRRWPFAHTWCTQTEEPLAARENRTQFIQPDYVKWQQIRRGMHRDDVRDLLGEPLYREDNCGSRYARDLIGSDDTVVVIYSWKYGHLEFADPSLPADTFVFSIDFEPDSDRVFEIRDPFGGRFSKDGVPTVPRLLVPPDGSSWSHYPPLLDLRWEPSSGVYPIRYEVGLSDVVPGSEEVADYVAVPLEICNVPHHTIIGSPKGRWRVRAHNRLGRSEWSEYRRYEFTRQG